MWLPALWVNCKSFGNKQAHRNCCSYLHLCPLLKHIQNPQAWHLDSTTVYNSGGHPEWPVLLTYRNFALSANFEPRSLNCKLKYVRYLEEHTVPNNCFLKNKNAYSTQLYVPTVQWGRDNCQTCIWQHRRSTARFMTSLTAATKREIFGSHKSKLTRVVSQCTHLAELKGIKHTSLNPPVGKLSDLKTECRLANNKKKWTFWKLDSKTGGTSVLKIPTVFCQQALLKA